MSISSETRSLSEEKIYIPVKTLVSSWYDAIHTPSGEIACSCTAEVLIKLL
jgi:hypothetical protein